MSSHFMQTSLAAGEIAPVLYARVDLEKYKSGTALSRNFFVDYRGGQSTRAGTQFIGRCKSTATGQPRAIDFIVSTVATYVLEFGNNYIRFISNGAYVTKAAIAISGITQANPGVVTAVAHGLASGNEVELAGILGMTQLNGRNFLAVVVDANHFSLQDLNGVGVNTTGYSAYISGGNVLPILEIASPYITSDLPLLKYTQSADTMTLTHQSYPPYDLKRVTTTNFTLTQAVTGPTIGIPANNVVTPVNNSTTHYIYAYIITAVSASGEESLGSYPCICATDILNQTSGIVNKIAWGSTVNAASYRIYKSGPTPSAGLTASTPISTVFGFIGQPLTESFVDNNIAPDFSQTPPVFEDPFSPGQLADIRVSGAGAGYAGQLTSLTFTGGGGTGAAGYGLVNETSGTVVGAVITNPGKGYTTAPVVTDDQGSTATYVVTLGQLSGTYPACCGYFQQRRGFGGTPNFPESFVLSQPGNYYNFNTNYIELPADAITASIASRQVNAIKSMTSMPTGLVVLTTGSGFLVSGGSQGSAVTASSIVALPQASSGCNDLPPLVVNNDILYGQNRGSVIRDLAFNFYTQSYTGTDRSVLASHLFSGFSLNEWCYAEEPFRIVHVIRSDGTMLNFTYVPEQEIFAWTHFDTNGLFVSVASIPEGQQNAVYTIVRRYIQGQWVYYMERFSSRLFNYVEDAQAVDASLQWPQVFPAAGITLASAALGSTTVTADAGVFGPGDVNKVIWAGGGYATVSGYISVTQVQVDITRAFPTLSDDDRATPLPFASGAWTLDVPTQAVSGLDHLEGMSVTGLGDGVVLPPATVVNGSITLPQPCTKITVGLSYQCRLQTLKLDAPQAETMQGKRKLINAVTSRLDKTLGLKIGQNFNSLVEMRNFGGPYSPGAILPSGDFRQIIQGSWAKEGQVCFQQDYPLPATILGLITEFTPGDTAR